MAATESDSKVFEISIDSGFLVHAYSASEREWSAWAIIARSVGSTHLLRAIARERRHQNEQAATRKPINAIEASGSALTNSLYRESDVEG